MCEDMSMGLAKTRIGGTPKPAMISGRPPRLLTLRSGERFASLPALIRRARNVAGQSATSLAQKLGVGLSRVNEWETGSKIPRRRHLAPLAEFLDIRIDALVLLRAAAKIDRRFRAGAASAESMHRALVAVIEAEADLRSRGSSRLDPSRKADD